MASPENEDMTTAIKSAKAQLRKTINTALRKLSSDHITEQSTLVQSKLFSLPEYQNARSLSIFLSMPSGEIQTESIVHHAFDHGKSVFIPYLRKNTGQGPKSVMDMVELFSKQDFTELRPDKWGIPSLSKDALPRRKRCPGDDDIKSEPTKLDLIVMPGVAFDKKLQRLGHGKGYYDFFLDRYSRSAISPANSVPFLVALALQEQILPHDENIPIDASDWSIDALIVGNGTIERRPPS